MEVHDPSPQAVPPQGKEDSGGNAAERGVGHVHSVTGASLSLLHPGHDPVEQVEPVAQAQGVSSVALDTQAQACLLGKEAHERQQTDDRIHGGFRGRARPRAAEGERVGPAICTKVVIY